MEIQAVLIERRAGRGGNDDPDQVPHVAISMKSPGSPTSPVIAVIRKGKTLPRINTDKRGSDVDRVIAVIG
jgi:hypothetical protein